MLTYGGRGFHPAHPIRFPIEQILLRELLDGEVKYIADAFQLTVGKKGKHPLLLKVPQGQDTDSHQPGKCPPGDPVFFPQIADIPGAYKIIENHDHIITLFPFGNIVSYFIGLVNIR